MEVIPAHPASIPRSHARFVLGDFSQLQISYVQLMCSCCSCSPISRDGHISFCQELNQNTNGLADINKAVEAVPESHLCPSGSFLLVHLMDAAMLSPVCNTHAAYNPFLSSWAHEIFIPHASVPQQHTFFSSVWWEQLEHALPKMLHMLSWWEGWELGGDTILQYVDIFQRLPFLTVRNCKLFDHGVVRA